MPLFKKKPIPEADATVISGGERQQPEARPEPEEKKVPELSQVDIEAVNVARRDEYYKKQYILLLKDIRDILQDINSKN